MNAPALTLLPPPARRNPTPYPVDVTNPTCLQLGKVIYVLDFFIAAERQRRPTAS